MLNYIVDWEEFNLIKDYVQPGEQVIDIGANIGYYSLWMSKFISPNGKIHSFEPDENNFCRLNKNIAANNLQDIICANKTAIGDEDGQLNFTNGLDERNHIAADNEKNVITIPVQKLDTYLELQNISTITYMKIDVEGFEYSVLEGANEILSNKRIDILQLEINKAIHYSGTTNEKLLELLNSYDYNLCRYDVKAKELLPVSVTNKRENYFAVYDLEKANKKLKRYLC